MDSLRQRLLGASTASIAGTDGAEADDTEEAYIRRRIHNPKWTLDRGAGYYAEERIKKNLPSLVQIGRHAGRSRVRYTGVDRGIFWKHILRRDFFTTAVNAKLLHLLMVLFAVYFSMLFGWALGYYILWRFNDDCFYGFEGYRSAFMFATETQQTIGYGARATGECWVAAMMVSLHSLQSVFFDCVILGIVFSRISHPKQRSRSVLLSDCAVIARRDGALKFMFRVADLGRRTAVDPRVRAYLFCWGQGRTTAEGEHVPVTAQELTVTMDRTLLLPVTVEHSIDEASPLYGHTLTSLEAVGAEVVVVFEAASELGDTFMARQSYLASEIHWGYTFVNVVHPPKAGETSHEVDLSRFHDVEPQPGLAQELAQPHRLSKRVVAGGSSAVPGRLLAENTLVLAECAVVAARNGRAMLMFRLGDTFPGQVLSVSVTAYLYRWQASATAEGEVLGYEEHPLELQPHTLLLRYPLTLVHDLGPDSPVSHWASQRLMRQDADAEVVVMATGTLLTRQQLVTRCRVYKVLGDIKWGHAFSPMLSHDTAKPGEASLDWSRFHATYPITMPTVSEGTWSGTSLGRAGPAGLPSAAASGSGQQPQQLGSPFYTRSKSSSTSTLPGLAAASEQPAASTGGRTAGSGGGGGGVPTLQALRQQQQQQANGQLTSQQPFRGLQGPSSIGQSQGSHQPSAPSSLGDTASVVLSAPGSAPDGLPVTGSSGAGAGCSLSAMLAAPRRMGSASRLSEVSRPAPPRSDDGSLSNQGSGASSLKSAVVAAGGGSGVRSQQGTAAAMAMPSGSEQVAGDRSWQQTRSLFAVLDSMQHYYEEQQQEQEMRRAASVPAALGDAAPGGADAFGSPENV